MSAELDIQYYEAELSRLEETRLTANVHTIQSIENQIGMAQSRLGRALLYEGHYSRCRDVLSESVHYHLQAEGSLVAISDLIYLAKAELFLGNLRTVVNICDTVTNLITLQQNSPAYAEELVAFRKMIQVLRDAASALPPSG